MKATSSKPLFRAISGQAKRRQEVALGKLMHLPQQKRQDDTRRDLDLYPTGDREAVRSLLACDWVRIASLSGVWEPAAGKGDMSAEITAAGLRCRSSDITNHGGCSDLVVRDFYDWQDSPAPAIITNPPYCEINARDGHGRWLRHTLSMPSWRYCALLLSWDWPAARKNGLGELLSQYPFSYCYLMRWKLDFTGEGSPPQRNAWFVWDRDDPRSFDRSGNLAEPGFRLMDRSDYRQGDLL